MFNRLYKIINLNYKVFLMMFIYRNFMKKILGTLFMLALVLPQFAVFAQDVTAGPVVVPVSECVALTRTLKYGNTSLKTEWEVSALKRFLKKFGYLNISINEGIKIDDVFDRETQKALKAFQQDYNILVDGLPNGVTGSLTRKQIKALSCVNGDPTQKINILSQNSGEKYAADSFMTIKWETNSASSRDVRVNIYSLDKALGSNMVFSAFVLDGAKEKRIRIPADLKTGNYKVMVHEVLKDSVYGVSNPFIILSSDESSPSIYHVGGPSELKLNKAGEAFGAWGVYASDPMGGILDFYVSWGDGSPSISVKDIEGSGKLAFSHFYKKAGDYKLTFRVTNAVGKSAERIVNLKVLPVPVINPIIYGISGPTLVSVNKEASWLVLGSAPAGENLTYSVSWGEPVPCIPDEACNQIKLPEQSSPQFFHTYKEAGEYTIVFYVHSSGGGLATKEHKIKVTGGISSPVKENLSANSAL